MYEIFDSNKVNYEQFFIKTQHGEGYYEGLPFQRGYGQRQYGQGLGTLFGSFWRYFSPILKNAGHELGREGLATGARILSNVSQGENIKSAATRETRQGVKNLIKKSYQNMTQEGEGRKPKQKRKRAIIGTIYNLPEKKQKNDIFENY